MSSAPTRLSDADARMLDALMEVGFDLSRLEPASPADRARAEALVAMLGHLDRLPAPEPVSSESRVSSVMAHIDAAEGARRERMRLGAPTRTVRRLRLPDIVSIAAVLLLAVGVGWPLASSMRNASLREACGRNLGTLSAGLDRYAGDHAGRLPMTASFAAIFQPESKSAAPERLDWRTYRHGESLELLRAHDYVGSRCLTCPGCEKDKGALAFRVPASGQRFNKGLVTGMLVADANPAIDFLRSGEEWRPGTTISSLNHSSQGQNVLFDDGSVRWLLSPIMLNGDSIWVPRDGLDATALERGELPTDPADHFLAQ